jgi:hypothetical protein
LYESLEKPIETQTPLLIIQRVDTRLYEFNNRALIVSFNTLNIAGQAVSNPPCCVASTSVLCTQRENQPFDQQQWWV